MGTTLSAVVDALFPQVRGRVLGLLFSRPDERFYVRQIVELVGQGHGQTQRELQRLGDAGILTRTREGNQLYYQANPECPVYAELRGLATKTTGAASVLEAALTPLADRIDTAFVFGSFARGRTDGESDVDLMVIGDASFADVVEAVRPVERVLSREINPTVYSRREFRRRLAEGGHFVSRVVGGEKLFLIGGPDELGHVSH